MTLDIDALAETISEELNSRAINMQARDRDELWNDRLAERIIANHLRAALPQRYAVHRVVGGVVCPDACGVVTVGRVGQ